MVETLSIEEFYTEGAKSQKLFGLSCENGHVTSPPRHSCMVCDSLSLHKEELSGLGKIIEFTQVFSKSKDFPLETPYFLALVQLNEGPNLLGIIEEPMEQGTAVKISFKGPKGERPRIFFSKV